MVFWRFGAASLSSTGRGACGSRATDCHSTHLTNHLCTETDGQGSRSRSHEDHLYHKHSKTIQMVPAFHYHGATCSAEALLPVDGLAPVRQKVCQRQLCRQQSAPRGFCLGKGAASKTDIGWYRMYMEDTALICTEIYILECSLHDFNGMKPILRYAWDSCRFLWILQSPNFRCRKTCFSLGNVNSLTRWFQLEMGSSLETEIKVAKLLQKQHWVLLDDFFYSHGRALLTRVWSMVWGV